MELHLQKQLNHLCNHQNKTANHNDVDDASQARKTASQTGKGLRKEHDKVFKDFVSEKQTINKTVEKQRLELLEKEKDLKKKEEIFHKMSEKIEIAEEAFKEFKILRSNLQYGDGNNQGNSQAKQKIKNGQSAFEKSNKEVTDSDFLETEKKIMVTGGCASPPRTTNELPVVEETQKNI